MKKTILLSLGILFLGVLGFFILKPKNETATISDLPTPYTCPEQNYINCMPSIYDPNDPSSVKRSEILETLCSEEHIQWLENNCPDFEEVAY